MEMKYSKEFLDLYENINLKIKKEKQNVKNSVSDIRYSEILLYFLSFISIIAFFMAPVNSAKYIFITVGVCMLIISFVYMIINEIKIYGIKSNFKKIIMREFTNSIGEDFKYKDNESITEVYYRKSGFNQTYKNIYSDGYIKSNKDGRNIEIGNISVIKDITKNNQNITAEVFNGIFAYSTIKNNIDEIDLMRVNSKNNKKEKLEIQNGKLYMYSEDIMKARKILNDDILQKVLNLKKELGIDLELMINKNEVFFRFFTSNIVSTNLFASKNEKQTLYYYYCIINFILDFLKELDKS